MALPERRPLAPSAADIDAQAALDALDDGICIISQDWRITFANRAFAAITSVLPAESLSRDVREIFPGLWRALGEVQRGLERGCVIAHPTSPSRTLDVRRAVISGGAMVLRLRDVAAPVDARPTVAEVNAENAALREVGEALANETDVDSLLHVICEQTAQQCAALGATVVHVGGGNALIVAATGFLAPMRGRRFPLAGSLTERTIDAGVPVRIDDYRAEHPRFIHFADEFDIGPALFAPLLAHEHVFGALTVARPMGSPPFTEGEERRIKAVAYYAALALWKARLIEEARTSSRLKGDFIATMSHELRTPLAALVGYEELLAEQILGPLTEQQLGTIERMRASTQHLSQIIEEILTFSRLEAGEERARPREVVLHELVRTVSAVLEPLAVAKRLVLGFELPSEEVELRTDGDMLRRILVNLGGNAIKFTERGSVTIRATLDGAVLSFEIIDTGIGIAAEDMGRLFRPFTQLDTGFTRRFGGTGLGLFVSRRLAQLLDGEITLKSMPGEGSTFTVKVPRTLG